MKPLQKGQYVLTRLPRFNREPVLMIIRRRATRDILNNPIMETDMQYLHCNVITPEYNNRVHDLTERYIYDSGNCTLLSEEEGQKQERLLEKLSRI